MLLITPLLLIIILCCRTGLPDYTPLIKIVNKANVNITGPGYGEGTLDVNVCNFSLSSFLLLLSFLLFRFFFIYGIIFIYLFICKQLIMSVAQRATTYYWATENDITSVAYITEVLQSDTPPLVLSISYGGPEIIPDAPDPRFQASLDVGMCE